MKAHGIGVGIGRGHDLALSSLGIGNFFDAGGVVPDPGHQVVLPGLGADVAEVQVGNGVALSPDLPPPPAEVVVLSPKNLFLHHGLKVSVHFTLKGVNILWRHACFPHLVKDLPIDPHEAGRESVDGHEAAGINDDLPTKKV